jgi:CcmD family protein
VKRTVNIIIFLLLISLAAIWQSTAPGGRSAGPFSHAPFASASLYAQETAKPAADTAPVPDKPADAPGVLWQVMGVIMVIWLGLALFLYRIDRRVAKLEKSLTAIKGKDS